MINSKDEIIHWFRHQAPPTRIETICALLECCLPFELRFAGTVLENLGKRDFHDLRDAEQRANKFITSGSNSEEHRALLIRSLLTDVPSVPSNGGIGSWNSNHHQHHSRNSPAALLADKNNRINNKLRQSSIPSINHDPQGTSVPNRPPRPAEASDAPGNINKSIPNANFVPVNGLTTSKLIENHVIMDQTSSHNSGDSEDDVDSVGSNGDQNVLLSLRIRHRMILYLALLQTSNRDGANAFYELMNPGEVAHMPFDRLPLPTLRELALLYTIAFYHPAFTFNQHYQLSEILMCIKLNVYRKELAAFGHPIYAQGYDQKTGQVYLYQIAPPHLNQVQAHQQQQMQLMQQHHHSQHVVQATVPTPQPIMGVNSVGPPQNTAPGVQSNCGTTTNQAKPVIVDTTRGSNQPTPQQYAYPTNFPVFMSQSPPNSNPLVYSAPYFANPQMASFVHPSNPIHTAVPTQGVNNFVGEWNMKRNLDKDEGSPTPSTNGNDLMLEPFQINVDRPRNISCFNCGSQTHYGSECKESSMEDMTRHLYRLNFNSKTESS